VITFPGREKVFPPPLDFQFSRLLGPGPFEYPYTLQLFIKRFAPRYTPPEMLWLRPCATDSASVSCKCSPFRPGIRLPWRVHAMHSPSPKDCVASCSLSELLPPQFPALVISLLKKFFPPVPLSFLSALTVSIIMSRLPPFYPHLLEGSPFKDSLAILCRLFIKTSWKVDSLSPSFSPPFVNGSSSSDNTQ